MAAIGTSSASAFTKEGLVWQRVSPPPPPSFWQSNKFSLAATLVALVALGFLIAGKCLLTQSTTSLHLGKVLLKVGGAMGILEGIFLLMRYYQNQRPPSYVIASYNIGTLSDFENITIAREYALQGQEAGAAMRSVAQEGRFARTRKPTAELNAARAPQLQATFQEFQRARADFICLQEIDRFPNIEGLLPSNYASINEGNTTLLAWDRTKLRHVATATYHYSSDVMMGFTNPDTILLFEDTQGFRICVTSAYLRGYNLERYSPETTRPGEYQTAFAIHAMSQVEADLYLFAGDCNVTSTTTSSNRLQLLEDAGYVPDYTDLSPTMFDGNLRTSTGEPVPLKLDHIYARRTIGTMTIQQHPVSSQTLANLHDRPSDHLPVGARVTLL